MSAPAGAERVVLWRHGRTAANAEGRFQGQLDVPLDDHGHQQAEQAASALAALEPARLVSSDLSRAVQTAQALADRTGLEVETDPALRELHAGSWQGLLHPEITARWPQMHAAWRSGEDVAVGGGERRSEVGRRVAASVRRHAATTPDGGTLVVTSHSGALRAAVLQLLGLSTDAWPRLGSLANCRWALVVPRDGGWTLAGYDLGPVAREARAVPAPPAAAAEAATV